MAIQVSEIVATTIQNRSKKLANNVLKNNGLLTKLSQSGRVKPFGGGNEIMCEISFAENATKGWYSGGELLSVASNQMITAALYPIKQAAVSVVITGLEELQNSGPEQMIDLMEGRISISEDTLTNLLAVGVYSDGTASGGKQIDGLDKYVSTAMTNSVGGIDPADWPGWANKYTNATTLDKTTVQAAMNKMWASLVRGADRPDLIPMDSEFWGVYVGSLQAQQRFTDPETAKLGFPTIKYMDADCLLDGGIGGACAARTAFFLNTKYLYYKPHRQRNCVPINPGKRYAINQDATVQLIGWAGNLVTSGRQFQGRLSATTITP